MNAETGRYGRDVKRPAIEVRGLQREGGRETSVNGPIGRVISIVTALAAASASTARMGSCTPATRAAQSTRYELPPDSVRCSAIRTRKSGGTGYRAEEAISSEPSK